MYDFELREIVERFQRVRMDAMKKYPFYALLLMKIKLSIDENCETAYTDGHRIAFSPKFLGEIDDKELLFVLMHEILHVALLHCSKSRISKMPNQENANIACDIVVNSNILYSSGMDLKAITLKEYGVSMHLAPDGKEGYLYTAEEVYKMLPEKPPTLSAKSEGGQENSESSSDKSEKDKAEKADGENITDNSEDTGEGEGSSEGEGTGEGEGSGEGEGGESDGSSEGDSTGEGDGEDNNEGSASSNGCGNSNSSGNKRSLKNKKPKAHSFDSHEKWNGDFSEQDKNEWINNLIEATAIVLERNNNGSDGCGKAPLGAIRLVEEYINPQVDWREILAGFLQEEINDYSFTPPDRRFSDSDFFLPDFNEKDESPKNIWFVVDASASVSDKDLDMAYAEICSAIEQFNGKLEGKISFLDCAVSEPVEFSSIEEIRKIKPIGGGGTAFFVIFQYMKNKMIDNLPSFIVIITDGYDAFPDEKEAMGIPVLWLLNNEEAEAPSWGKVARIKRD